MRSVKSSRSRWLLGFGLLAGGLAWASPWDIDMMDAVQVKPFEQPMRPTVPEGSVQRPQGGAVTRPGEAGVYQNDYERKLDRFVDGGNVNTPYGHDAAQVALGQKIFAINCQPCHGAEGKGGGPVTHNNPEQKIARFPVPAPMLSGPGNVSTLRSDGYIYLTIRNGGAVMPAHAVMLTSKERWSVVSYIRSLEGTAYVPPAPATTGNP